MSEDTTTPETVEESAPQYPVTIEDAGTLKKKVTVTIPAEMIAAKYDEMYGELQTSVTLPGFRTGHAPKRLVEKRFGKEIAGDVRNSLLGEALGQALEESDLKTLGEPDLKLDDVQLPDKGDLVFDFEVEIEPEFDLPDVSKMTLTREDAELTDERVDEYLENMRQGQAQYEKTEEAAQAGDMIVGSAKITGEEIDFDSPRVSVRVAPGVIEGIPFADLAKDLTGKKLGDVVTLSADVADTHPTEAWQGKTVSIALTIKEISHRVLPELNEEFASKAGFETLAEYREFISSILAQRLAQDTQQKLRQQACDYLLENTSFELPEGIVKRQSASALQRQVMQMMQNGMPREQVQENIAEMQSAAEETAIRELKMSFLLGKYAEEKEIDVDEAEVNSRIAQMAQMYNRRPERLRHELTSNGTLEHLAVSIREDKAIDLLIEGATVEDAPAPKAEKKTAKKATKKTAKKSTAKKADDAEPKAKKTTKKATKKTTKKTTKKDKE